MGPEVWWESVEGRKTAGGGWSEVSCGLQTPAVAVTPRRNARNVCKMMCADSRKRELTTGAVSERLMAGGRRSTAEKEVWERCCRQWISGGQA